MISGELARRVLQDHPDSAPAWLAQLEGQVASRCRRWQLEPDGEPLAGGTSLVLPVQVSGTAAVLKAMHPAQTMALHSLVLDAVPPSARPLVLQVDADQGAMVLERLGPGLDSVPDPDAAITIARRLSAAWAVPAPADLPRLADGHRPWTAQVVDTEQRLGVLGPQRLARVLASIDALCADPADQRHRSIVHGDLYAPNALASSRGHWVAIDPEPCAGPRSHDCATVIADRFDALPAGHGFAPAVRHRVQLFARAAEIASEECREVAIGRLGSWLLAEQRRGRTERAAELGALLDALL